MYGQPVLAGCAFLSLAELSVCDDLAAAFTPPEFALPEFVAAPFDVAVSLDFSRAVDVLASLLDELLDVFADDDDVFDLEYWSAVEYGQEVRLPADALCPPGELDVDPEPGVVADGSADESELEPEKEYHPLGTAVPAELAA